MIETGYSGYSEETLSFYDDWMKVVNSDYWRCSTDTQLDHYKKFISKNHLDIGVATGNYLDETYVDGERLVLMDMNQNCLNMASTRLKRFYPETFFHSVLEPFSDKTGCFDSIAANNLFHCVPGTFKEKGIAFKYIYDALNEGGVFFGATILGKGKNVIHTDKSLEMLNNNNESGMFFNINDSEEDLFDQLNIYFDKSKLEVIGCIALFSAIK